MSTHPDDGHGRGPASGWQDRGSEAEERGPEDVYRSRGVSSRDSGRYHSERSESERFWSKVDRSDPEGCWVWLGQRNAWGYGHFRRTLVPGTHVAVKAHRFAYELVVGQIPAGLTLDHMCGRPACVRPDHLEPVTNIENLRRRHARRRAEGTQP